MFILVVELNLAKCRLPKGPKFEKVLKVATLEKFYLTGGNQDRGDPGVGKVRGEGFFSFKQRETDPG